MQAVVESPSDVEVVHEKWSVCNPLEHANWDSLLTGHAGVSIFHTQAWAQVLHETYGHLPCYFCNFSGGQLLDLLPVMEVNSRLTGRRGVSLPFSDFCDPFSTNRHTSGRLHDLAMEHGRDRGWQYLECRSGAPWSEGPPEPLSVRFHGHAIQLNGSNQQVLPAALGDSVRRGIRKARRSGLQVELETSVEAIRAFYSLHCKTRKRHGMPPQPFRFFANVARLVLQSGKGFIATTFFKARPIAALVFLRFGRQALYKFGASDYAFQHLRPNNLAMWEGIKHCAALGCTRLHLGRTSLINEGLRRFKLGFGASEEILGCRKYDFESQAFVQDTDRSVTWMNKIWHRLPIPALRLAGQAIYPHLS